MSKSHFGQLCAYLMSCDTHYRTCPRYSPRECSSQVSKKIEKIFFELSRGQAWSYGRTDGWSHAKGLCEGFLCDSYLCDQSHKFKNYVTSHTKKQSHKKATHWRGLCECDVQQRFV